MEDGTSFWGVCASGAQCTIHGGVAALWPGSFAARFPSRSVSLYAAGPQVQQHLPRAGGMSDGLERSMQAR